MKATLQNIVQASLQRFMKVFFIPMPSRLFVAKKIIKTLLQNILKASLQKIMKETLQKIIKASLQKIVKASLKKRKKKKKT